ncbi:EscU/YscU/HrcU family type III secretion system export apparatus switch protein [Paraburkholderia phosphatilytica]|uniref:EscU/YscU/HrcU family type III secretion system export apparatus switch protein n=1 Tax=Paraburkholderia phosphatilytica TaxID=2282883 RepID=UPI000E4D2419|nr:EscU/YscU/HrcU family type III secretion system export apparatus switch protein [Paraburkholderia phosphatilytica]
MSQGGRRRSAAALVYDKYQGDTAPRVVAKGYGVFADMIVKRAQEAGLYVHTAPEMVSLLMQVDLDARIPPQLYQAVAELLAWLYRLESGVVDAPTPAVRGTRAVNDVEDVTPSTADDGPGSPYSSGPGRRPGRPSR